jgi:hypothetical protein
VVRPISSLPSFPTPSMYVYSVQPLLPFKVIRLPTIFIQAEPKARLDLPKTDRPSPRKRHQNTTIDSATPSSQPDPTEPETILPSIRKRGGAKEPLKASAKESSPSPPPPPVQVVLADIPDEAGASVDCIMSNLTPFVRCPRHTLSGSSSPKF